jgi:tetratricopeptide (TPR) repeat protein
MSRKPIKRFQTSKSKIAEKSIALKQAMNHVKDSMTDAQKSFVLLREGKNNLENNEIRGALDCFSQAIVFNPTVNLFNYRAICHKLLEMFSEAYFDYSYAIRIEPESGTHYMNRALCLAHLKKFHLAIEDCNSAIEYEPTAIHYYSRACIYSDFGRFTNAVAGNELPIYLEP